MRNWMITHTLTVHTMVMGMIFINISITCSQTFSFLAELAYHRHLVRASLFENDPYASAVLLLLLASSMKSDAELEK
jgi:hypothetical protein